jgi:hypothetical protein
VKHGAVLLLGIIGKPPLWGLRCFQSLLLGFSLQRLEVAGDIAGLPFILSTTLNTCRPADHPLLLDLIRMMQFASTNQLGFWVLYGSSLMCQGHQVDDSKSDVAMMAKHNGHLLRARLLFDATICMAGQHFGRASWFFLLQPTIGRKQILGICPRLRLKPWLGLRRCMLF